MIPDSLSPIANHLWQSTLFAAAAGLVTLALRKNSARARYWVWVAASFKFLIPFSVLVAIGGLLEWRTASAIASPYMPIAVEQFSQPFTATTISLPALASPATSHSLPAILFGIWACGFIGISISWWIRWRRISAAVRVGTPVQLDFPIQAISSPSFMEPGIFGIFRPVLLLPKGISEHLTPEQWKSIVAHELCHVRHRDNLIGAVQMFVETVFWFHPLVWWIGKRIVQERERACDEEVLGLGIDPRTYAQGILKVCELYLESPMACVSGISGANLKRRIEGILSNRMAMKLSSGKKLLLGTVGIAAIVGPIGTGLLTVPVSRAQALQTQNITGDWQGALKAGGRELRVVFKISVEDDKLQAVMYSIDQGGQGRPASAISRNGSTIKIEVASMRGNYEGKLSADGKTMVGTWSQGNPLPLSLVRATPETAWTIPEPPAPPVLMSANANPVFEVATIKPSQSAGSVLLQVSPSGLFTTTGTSVTDLLKFAYDLHARQIIGGPSWLEDEKYDVTGKPDTPGRPNLTQLKAMVQKLLADRFQLAIHRDKRELSVYAITVPKSGPKLPKNDSDPSGLPGGMSIGLQSLALRNATIAEFATLFQAAGSILDRPVVDQTGLGSAKYDFALRWTPDGPQPQAGGVEPRAANVQEPPDLFAAFQEQLGLKLESTKAPFDVIVIDHLERPSEN